MTLRADFSRHGRAGVQIGLPAPGLRVPALPERLTLELDDDELRILNRRDGRLFDARPRGAIDARVTVLQNDVELSLRWPDDERRHLIRAEASAEAMEVAEALARDSRVARGADPETDAALMRLAAETLPPELLRERHDALRKIAELLERGERPLVVAGGDRGLDYGIVLLTDRTLFQWAGGRKTWLDLPREELAGACTNAHGWLFVADAAGRRYEIEDIKPPERAEEIVAALGLPLLPDGKLDDLAVSRADAARVIAAWEVGEVPQAFATGTVGWRSGVLGVTDRRLLWVPRKDEPVALDRAQIVAARMRDEFLSAHLLITLRNGDEHVFELVGKRDATKVLAALEGS
jgi:hypothetical protein